MLSLPEDTVTRVQRKRASKPDKGSGEEGKMTKLMRGLELIIELKTIQAVTLLVSMSTQSWQFCQPPRVLFSPVCCKQDKTQKWENEIENPTGRVSQMLCSRYSICSLHILAQWPSFSSPPVEIKQRAQWQVETESVYKRGESTEASVSDLSHRGVCWAREWMKRPQCGLPAGPKVGMLDACSGSLRAVRDTGKRRWLKRARPHDQDTCEHGVLAKKHSHRQTAIASEHSRGNWRRLHRKWQRGAT